MEDAEGYLALNIQARKQQSPISVSREPDRPLRYRCYRWIITGAGCVVVSLLVGAVIALRICAFQRRQYKEAFDKSVDSQETSNGTEIKHRLENVVSRLQTILCKQVLVNSTESFRCHLCPGNWSYHNGKCYWISKELGTWDKSQEDCRARGAQMLVLKEQEEMTFIQSISDETQSLWIGLKGGMFPERQWMWADDSPLNENLLQELGPLLGDSCGMLIGPRIVAETCSTLSLWVCQAEALGSATTIQRILAYGKLKAILIGISVPIVGGIFFGLGTLVPLYRQQDAIKYIPVTCPPHWIGYEGHCYYFSEEAKTFNESQNFCRLHNASLAKIPKEDMEFVTNITRNEVYWIDLIKKATQPWKWGDGETATLKVWGDGGDCAYLNDDGTANSGRCINKHRFICQKSIL